MPYYRICPNCGSSLDPGERCDCQDEETAPDATNIESGKVESELTDPLPPPILTNEQEEIKYENFRSPCRVCGGI